MAALDELNSLLASLPGYALLTTTMKQGALDGSLYPDSFGVWPGEEGYEATYDVYFAALRLLPFLMAQPVLRSTSSEGTSASVDAPNWHSLATYLTSQSPILSASSSDVLRAVAIPDHPHVKRVPMEVEGI